MTADPDVPQPQPLYARSSPGTHAGSHLDYSNNDWDRYSDANGPAMDGSFDHDGRAPVDEDFDREYDSDCFRSDDRGGYRSRSRSPGGYGDSARRVASHSGSRQRRVPRGSANAFPASHGASSYGKPR